MADYYAEPIWDESGRTSFDLDLFPLSSELKTKLRAWAKDYDSFGERNFTWPTEDGEERFDEAGRLLWREVQEELGEDWKVSYFSEVGNRVIWDTG
jgi:hypothetical protein